MIYRNRCEAPDFAAWHIALIARRVSAASAFLCLIGSVSACAPRLSTFEVNEMLAKGAVEVGAETSRNSVHVSTKGEAFGTSVMSNGQGGLAGVLIGAAIVAATAEDAIPNIDNITQPIADNLAKKFPRPNMSTESFYKILIAGGPRLAPAAEEQYQLSYEVGMQISNLRTNVVLSNDMCRETEASLMPLEQWRASVSLIKAFRSKMIATCTARFAKTLNR